MSKMWKAEIANINHNNLIKTVLGSQPDYINKVRQKEWVVKMNSRKSC